MTLESSMEIETRSTINELRVRVEKALSHFGERESDSKNFLNKGIYDREAIRLTSEFRGQLSTNPDCINKDPDRKKINKQSLAGKCGIFRDELQRCLELVGLKSEKTGLDHSY